MFRKVLITGASRGLGKAVALQLTEHFTSIAHVILTSRSEKNLSEVREQIAKKNAALSVEWVGLDLSRQDEQKKLARIVRDSDFDLVIFCAGGGPYGEFRDKDWKDHDWALQLGLMAPMQMTHAWIQSRKPESAGKCVLVGSEVAESAPDINAASYAASKHGLLGFVRSLQAELEQNANAVWLFSPSYMDTEMLPPGAKVRKEGGEIMKADWAARELLNWLKEDGPWHRVVS